MAQILSWLKDHWLQWTTCFCFRWEWDLWFAQEIPQTVSFCHNMKLSAVEDAGLSLPYNLPIFNCWWFVLCFLIVCLFVFPYCFAAPVLYFKDLISPCFVYSSLT